MDKKELLNERLDELGALINTQNNRITSHPIFVIERRVRDYGYEADYVSDYAWIDYVNDDVADEGQHENLDAVFKEDGNVDGWVRAYYKDRWEFVTCCFTEDGCKDYLRINGHNVGESRIYVYSGWRNHEWQRIRMFLMDRGEKSE